MKWFKWRETRWGAYTFAACSAVLFFVILENLGVIGKGIGKFIGFFTPVIYGLILAYIMDFFVKFIEDKLLYKMESRKKARTVAVAIDTVVVVLIFLLLIMTLLPQIISSIHGIITDWDKYAAGLSEFTSSFSGSSGSKDLTGAIDDVSERIGSYLSENSDAILNKLSSVGSALMTWAIAFIMAIYFLLAKNYLIKGVKKILQAVMTEERYVKGGASFRRINEIFSKYIVCEIIDAVIVGCANALFMIIAGMPYVVLVSVVVGVTNLAPTFGPIVGAVVGSAILLLVHPASVIPFLIFTVVIQTIDGYVIKPKMYGGALSVPSVWILVAIIVLGRMFGVAGILLAIPVAAIITYWFRDFMNHRGLMGDEEDDDSSAGEDGTADPEKAVE